MERIVAKYSRFVQIVQNLTVVTMSGLDKWLTLGDHVDKWVRNRSPGSNLQDEAKEQFWVAQDLDIYPEDCE